MTSSAYIDLVVDCSRRRLSSHQDAISKAVSSEQILAWLRCIRRSSKRTPCLPLVTARFIQEFIGDAWSSIPPRASSLKAITDDACVRLKIELDAFVDSFLDKFVKEKLIPKALIGETESVTRLPASAFETITRYSPKIRAGNGGWNVVSARLRLLGRPKPP
eukprot:TRINITY_DN47229_c0_g1_i1.p1 TRINITY_DN47229_c0_g1~~TRINITY_DN47229_c0_g1_i1.p1  ORF type:complete len:162 (+),score=32.93 TRINITY_DN47229_c0_g1_i1:37-522(+)